jgi:hypothetical protein
MKKNVKKGDQGKANGIRRDSRVPDEADEADVF